jgi:hypothetical protein
MKDDFFKTDILPGHVYGYRYDFSEYAHVLEEMDRCTEITRDMLTALRNKTGHDWRLGAEGQYSLLDAVIEYNGVNHKWLPTNSNYSHAMVVVLSKHCHGLSGKLVIQYNVKK